MDWGYFPEKGERCLVAVRGFSINSGGGFEGISFTLCENLPPFYELRDFPPIPLAKAADRRAELIAQHCHALRH